MAAEAIEASRDLIQKQVVSDPRVKFGVSNRASSSTDVEREEGFKKAALEQSFFSFESYLFYVLKRKGNYI